MPGEEPETRPHGPAAQPSGAADPTTNAPSADASPTQPAAVVSQPLRIGRYAIIKTLGRGGMGVVYLARDARDQREVALKVIPAGPDADPTDLARFRTEAEAVARLDHPNIVKLYEVGEGEGTAWLAMEYVDGGSLYRRIKNGGPLPIDEAARLVEQIARATYYAHTNGVVHRDLKPSNILLGKDEGGRMKDEGKTASPSSFILHPSSLVPKLADFGLAKQLDKSLRLTQTGIAVGTPHYMSPEQARGQAHQIGPLSDVHALGAILYELLVGLPPYDGGTAMETMQQVVDKKPVPPSQLRKEIPGDLEAICLMCLEKAPAKRYRTAEALADDLKAFLAGRSRRHPDDPTLIVQASRRKNRWLIPATVGVLALIALVAAGTWFFTSRAHREKLDAGSRAERRARLESAIAQCEAGHVSAGLEQMRLLESGDEADGLPIAEVIRAWEGRSLQPTAVQARVVASVLAVSPKGQMLAIGEGTTVSIGRVGTRAPSLVDWTFDGPVAALGWSENGVDLAVATADGRVFVGNVENGKLGKEPVIRRPNRTILAVGFAFPGVRVVYGGETLQQESAPPLRPQRPEKTNPFDLSGGPFVAAAIAPGRGDVAVVLATGAVRIYDAGDRRWRDLPPDGHASTVSYSSDGNVLAVGTKAGSVRHWDAIARVPLTEAATLGKPVAAVAVEIDDTDYLTVACPAPGAERAPGSTWKSGRQYIAPPIRLSNRPGREVIGVAFGSGGTSLYVTSPAGVSRWSVLDAKRYGPQRDYPASDHYGEPAGTAARFSAGCVHRETNTVLVGGSGGRLIQIDDSGDGQSVKNAPATGAMKEVTAVAAGPGGRTTYAGRTDDSRTMIRHWHSGMDGESQDRHFPFEIHQEIFLPDGSAVVLACGDGKVRVWDPGTDEIRGEFDCGKSPVLSVAVNDDGSRLLAGCADGTAHLWDLPAQKQLVTIRKRSEVRAVAFHKENLLTASADGTVRRWNSTGIPLGPPLAHPDAISALAVWGDLVATGGRDRFVRVWRLP